MTYFYRRAKQYRSPERMAEAYLESYFQGKKPVFPINSFQMLKDAGVSFAFGNFQKLEGVYFPAVDDNDMAFVGINCNRPITRQRFTAAHELCHHFRDADKQVACPIGERDETEKFADKFAAAILMPLNELQFQTNWRKNKEGYITFDDVLEIADYFGVSFESCLYRLAYMLHVIDGNVEPDELAKRAARYAPEKKRKERHMDYVKLYEDLINAYSNVLVFSPSEHARLVFQGNYIYNDSRMEGVQTTPEEAAEIVADLRLNAQKSRYCTEENEAFLSIAGHYAMYQDILALPMKETCSVFDMIFLNRKLFSYYPAPEAYGGNFRQNDTLVLGAKFETVSHHQIQSKLVEMDSRVKELFAKKETMALSEYIKEVIQIHHQLTVIHPFGDGNGRTLRAFLNVLLIRAKVSPLYIRAEEKNEYLAALTAADTCGSYAELYECLFKVLLRSSVDLSSASIVSPSVAPV